jgi:hypothetical protein
MTGKRNNKRIHNRGGSDTGRHKRAYAATWARLRQASRGPADRDGPTSAAGEHPIAVASACGACAHVIGGGKEWAPGRHMAIVHASHIAELVAAGWVLIENPHDPPDIVCSHYYAAWWQDGQ